VGLLGRRAGEGATLPAFLSAYFVSNKLAYYLRCIVSSYITISLLSIYYQHLQQAWAEHIIMVHTYRRQYCTTPHAGRNDLPAYPIGISPITLLTTAQTTWARKRHALWHLRSFKADTQNSGAVGGDANKRMQRGAADRRPNRLASPSKPILRSRCGRRCLGDSLTGENRARRMALSA